MNRLRTAWYWVQSSLWFIPGLSVLSAGVLAWLFIQIDRAHANGSLDLFHGRLAGGAEGTRDLLSTVAATTITLAGVVFSITIVALSQASTQFGPRLLRNFMRDKGSQAVMGIFTGTFVYCLLVLRTIRTPGSGPEAFIPQIAVSFGFLLALCCIGFLIFFIHHVSSSVQVDDVIARVVKEARAAGGVHPMESVGRPWEPGMAGEPVPEGGHGRLRSHQAGYLQSLDAANLYRFALRHDLTLESVYRPGDFVDAGDPLLRIWPPRNLSPAQEKAVRRLFILGSHRTPLQDFGYGINLIVEIAVRALSPSVNDPFTALMCLDRLEQMLLPLAEKPPPSRYRADDAGRLRIIDHPVPFPEFLSMALDPVRLFGSSQAVICCRALDFLTKAVRRSRIPEYRDSLALHARLFARERGWADAYDGGKVLERYQAFLHALGGDAAPESEKAA